MPDLSMLQSQDWRARQRAVAALADSAGQQSAADVAAALAAILRDRHRDFNAINAALQVIIRLGPAARDSLTALVADADAEARAYAALALGQLGDPAATPALLNCLQDTDANVRFNAIEALGSLQAQAAVAPLCAIVRGRDYYLASPAIDALRRIGDPAVATEMLDALSDDLLVTLAIDALGDVGGLSAVQPVAALLTSPPVTVDGVAGALCRLHQRQQAAAGNEDAVRRAVVQAISAAGQARLVARIEDWAAAPWPAASPIAAIALIGWMLDAGTMAPPLVRRAESALLALLRADTTRSAAAAALSSCRGSIGQDLIRLLADTDPATQCAAASLLGATRCQAGVPTLIGALDSDSDDLAALAAEALGRIGDASVHPMLAARLGHPSARVRLALVAALESLHHPDHAARLAALSRNPDPHVRESVAHGLGRLSRESRVKGLLALTRDSDERVRQAAAEGLSLPDGPQAGAALAALARDPSPGVRAAAAHSARAQAGPPADQPAADILRPLLADTDGWVRRQACLALGSYRRPELLDDFARLLQDPSPPVRAAAVEALASLDEDRAQALLLPLLNDGEATVAAQAQRALKLPS